MSVVAGDDARGLLLVVHDEPEAAAAIAGDFQRLGYDVDTASTFTDAEALLLSCRYDCLVTRLALPDGNGLDLLPICPRWFDCRSVVICPTADPRIRAAALAMGAADAVAEPVDARALHACLTAEAGADAAARQGAAPPAAASAA